MKKGIVIGAVAGGLALFASAAQADTVEVANGAELKAAIVQANSDSTVTKILCASYSACDVVGTLPTYTGDHLLIIDGRSSTIDASAVTDADAFASVGGGVLKLFRLNFVGGLSGVYVEVPASKTDNQRVVFRKVKVTDTILHGGVISDPNSAHGGIVFIVHKSNFTDNGLDEFEQGGLFVEETGAGPVIGKVTSSYLQRNGSDGLNVLEWGGGKVDVTIADSDLRMNGETGGGLGDPDDGFDVDENGGGDVIVTITDSRFNLNFDDGIDLDELGNGSLIFTMTNVKASRNGDQGITVKEAGDGDIDGDVLDSDMVENDLGSQEYDLRAVQNDAGSGLITLENTNIGDSQLTAVTLDVVP